MLIFWIICALFVLLALWFVLPPFFQKGDDRKRDERRAANLLVYQDQYQELEADLKNGLIEPDQYQQEKDELERRVLDDIDAPATPIAPPPARKLGYAVAAVIPIAAFAFYFLVGNPKALSPSAANATMPAPGNQQGDMRSSQQIEANVAKLAQRLQQNPNDAQGWVMLGRSYMSLERYADAANAYDRATVLNDKDAGLWADYAEALALANGRQLSGKPVDALNRALQLDPGNQKALGLAGSAAFQAGEYKKAIDYWEKLLKLLPPGAEEVTIISDQIAKAKELAAGKGSR
jgi:cytochrome c-type biogenesis protein CcmH